MVIIGVLRWYAGRSDSRSSAENTFRLSIPRWNWQARGRKWFDGHLDGHLDGELRARR
jgi:hypothetical protein